MQYPIDKKSERRMREVAAEYITKGYDVAIAPDQEQLPDFLRGYQPDILARGKNENVVVEVKSRVGLTNSDNLRQLARTVKEHPGWRLELIMANPDEAELLSYASKNSLSEQEIHNQLREAENLAQSGHLEAAFLLAWSTTEAVLRLLANRDEIPLRRYDASFVLKQLATYAIISHDEYDFLTEMQQIRNQLAHGFKAEGLETENISTLLTSLRQLLLVPELSV